MTPKQVPKSGVVEQLQFEQQNYDNRPLVEPIILALEPCAWGLSLASAADAGGEVCNEAQRAQLAQGLSMRPASGIPHTNAAHYDHPTLKNMLDASDPGQAHELGQVWNSLGNEIMTFGESLQNTANGSEAIWVGQAGTAARSALDALAGWSQHIGQGVQFMATTVRTQAEAAQNAKNTMPEPVNFDPVQHQARLNATSDLAEWMRLSGEGDQQLQKQQEAHLKAIRVVDDYSATLRETDTTMPAFTPPPRFGNRDTGHSQAVSPPDNRAGEALSPPHVLADRTPATSTTGNVPASTPAAASDSSTAGTSVDGNGSDASAPEPTPAQAVSDAPVIPDNGIPAGGEGGEPSVLPAATVLSGTGPVGGGARTGVRRVGTAFGPRGSGGLGTGNPRTGNFSNPPASNIEMPSGSGALKRGGAGSATSGFPPLSGTGPGEKDIEHQRPSYLIETEDIWGDGCHVAPPVIGEDPPEYHY